MIDHLAFFTSVRIGVTFNVFRNDTPVGINLLCVGDPGTVNGDPYIPAQREDGNTVTFRQSRCSSYQFEITSN